MRVSPGRKQISKENICETQNVHVMNNSWCKISQMEKQEIVEIVQLLETFLSFFRGNKTTHPEIMTDQPTICTRSHPPAKFNLPKSCKRKERACQPCFGIGSVRRGRARGGAARGAGAGARRRNTSRGRASGPGRDGNDANDLKVKLASPTSLVILKIFSHILRNTQ